MPVALVLLPGLLLNRRLYAAQLEALAGAADCLVADLTRHDTVAGLAADVLEQAPERFALAGLSMGGSVALEIMRLAPERVLRLALLDTQARPDTPEITARRRPLMALAEAGGLDEVARRLLPVLLHPSRLAEPEPTGTVLQMAREIGQDAFLRQERALIARPDRRPDLGAIACPTLVLAGREDALTPLDRQLELAHGIPDATLVLVPGCGHLAPLERPEAVNRQLLAWLQA